MAGTSRAFAALVIAVGLSGAALGQPDFKFTKIADINADPDANSATIRGAINAIGDNPLHHWTVLIYAGVYNENVILDDKHENIDLVGVDRESVIIQPTSAGSGVKIISGQETTRKNAVRNLTIVTDDGHGIEIVKGAGMSDLTPRDIRIEGVTIVASGTNKDGVYGLPAEEVHVFDCNVYAESGAGIRSGDYWTITSTRSVSDGQPGLIAFGDNSTIIRNCEASGTAGLHAGFQSSGLSAEGCVFSGGTAGVWVDAASHVLIRNSILRGDPNLNAIEDITNKYGIWIDNTPAPQNVVVLNCRIAAESNGNVAIGINHDLGDVRIEGCEIVAINTSTTSGGARGVNASYADTPLRLLGGSIRSSAAFEKSADVWDSHVDELGERCLMSGTPLSKWKGPIASAERPRVTVQRTLNVSASSATAVLAATGLIVTEKVVTTGITSPDVYRVLSATGNTGAVTGTVYVIGTDLAGNAITDTIATSGTATVSGAKPFKTVTKIILPPGTLGQTISIGTTSKLGLQFPISGAGAVLQPGRKASAATSYAIEATGTVDAAYSTVDVGTISAGDSFEWAAEASE